MADSNTKQIEPDGVRLGDAIRRAREALALSLRQLAPLVQLHHSFLARLEAGDYQTAKPAVLQRLSRVLELDAAEARALSALERLHEQQGQWIELVEICERKARFAEGEARLGLMHKVGRLQEGPLDAPEDAIVNHVNLAIELENLSYFIQA